MESVATLNNVPVKMDNSRRTMISKLVDDRQKLIDGFGEILNLIIINQDNPETIKKVISKTMQSIQ